MHCKSAPAAITNRSVPSRLRVLDAPRRSRPLSANPQTIGTEMPPLIDLDEVKARWLQDGWMRVSARRNSQSDKLLLSGFLYPPQSGTPQRLKLSGGHDPKVEYGVFNPEHAYLGPMLLRPRSIFGSFTPEVSCRFRRLPHRSKK
ncbi:MAG: hypothetical protein ABGX16_17160 [Pirellulales bacterium]